MNRKDEWSYEEDLLLAQTVLQHIESGSTQLNAFEEAGSKLRRTAAACGFRWNGAVRKQYESDIRTAKANKRTKKLNLTRNIHRQPDNEDNQTPFDQVISTLLIIKQEYTNMKQEIDKMREELERLSDQADANANPSPAEDIQNLLQIIQRAEKLGMFDKMKAKEKPTA
ncbi:RsfA family transcriptional regulator [Paenibacillus sp. JSM ZJ436]|uniref:RsfA family transcriptional regulator n=1 Tax=Paenibacillus sp. JSM ZJ436 TaxID=3376190 RepID=UPI00379A9754